MKRALRVLSVEDSEDDCQLVLRELQRAGYEPAFERVQTAAALARALDSQAWDVIISDYQMPGFDASQALALVQAKGVDIPFIIVSGTIGEETAVEIMRAGAHDFVLKNKLTRLGAAIERELREAAIHRERKQLHEHLVLSDRMASVGILAAGVAHEINNPLAAVLANLEFSLSNVSKIVEACSAAASEPSLTLEDVLKRVSRPATELQESLGDAREAAERIRLIVRDLRIFSRTEDQKSSPVDVQRILESSLRMASNEIRHRARLVKDYGNVPPVEADDSRLGQVFLNLIVNAAQAIPEGQADRNEIRITTRLDAEGRVVIEIADTGPGIPPDVLKHLFTPFFTTKVPGTGTGLGLAICHRLVTAFGGQIMVESQVGKGTAFRVVLPATSMAVKEEKALPKAAPARRRGRILVVDDDPLIGTAVQRMLASEHEVITLTHAAEALQRISGGERFDVVLCDLMMPVVSGMDFYAGLARVAPEQAHRMVLVSGGVFTAKARAFLDEVPNARLEKPFDLQNLRSLVNDRMRHNEPD